MFSIGLDLGGTTLRAAVVDRNTGNIVASERYVWTDRSPLSVLGEVAAAVNKLGAAWPQADGHLGVGFAGMLRGGVVVNAPNLGWRDVDFGTPLATATGRSVRMVNDLSAAAWGEFKAGSAQGTSDSLTVFVGTGVGSAIISGGQLVQGATQVAGEFGHVKVMLEGGRLCGCGQHGCLEAYMGGAKMHEWMLEEGLEGKPADLERMAQEGHPKAKAMYDFAVNHLALAVANYVTCLNPGVLVLGGGVLRRCPGVVERIRHVVAQRTVASSSAVRITMASLGDNAGLVGAALLT